MDEQHKSRESPDAHRHNSKLQQLDAEMQSAVPDEGAWQGRSHSSGCVLPL